MVVMEKLQTLSMSRVPVARKGRVELYSRGQIAYFMEKVAAIR